MYVVIEKTKNFSARLIQFWMWVDALVHGCVPKITYNHTFLIDGNTIWEAVEEGVVKTTFDAHFAKDKYKRGVNTRHIRLYFSPEEKEKVLEYLKSKEGTEYEHSNFIFHPLKTITDKWLGQKTDKKLNCYELIIRAINASGKYNIDPFLNPREFYEVIYRLK